jgi:hypothetical protein
MQSMAHLVSEVPRLSKFLYINLVTKFFSGNLDRIVISEMHQALYLKVERLRLY